MKRKIDPRKQVVVLMNGFGMEQKRSYEIYSSFLMPYLDSSTREMFFSNLKNECYNDESGYQLFSTGTDVLPSYPKLETWLNEEIKQDPVMIEYKKVFDKIENNIHIFAVLSNERMYRHIKEFLNFINAEKKKTIYLHVILDFPFVEDYKKIGDLLRKLSYDLNDTAQLKIIIGKNKIENNETDYSKELVRLLYKKYGEQWRDVEQKLSVLKKERIIPRDATLFCTDSNFELNDQDVIFFFNYDLLNVSDFISFVSNPDQFMNPGKKIESLSFFSLFPCMNTMKSIYDKNDSTKYFSKSLETFGKKALVVIEKEKVNNCNFYLNGYQHKVSPNIRYMSGSFDDLQKEEILKNILSRDEDIILLNYFVDRCENTAQLKDNLKKMDNTIPILKKLCEENKYSLWMTSLYGLRREMKNERGEVVLVDFYEKVPLLFHDLSYLKKSHKLLQGNLYDLQVTLLYLAGAPIKEVPLLSKKGIFG